MLLLKTALALREPPTVVVTVQPGGTSGECTASVLRVALSSPRRSRACAKHAAADATDFAHFGCDGGGGGGGGPSPQFGPLHPVSMPPCGEWPILPACLR